MILGCVCGGTLELLVIGITTLVGFGAWLWDHLTLKGRINRCRKTCTHTEACENNEPVADPNKLPLNW